MKRALLALIACGCLFVQKVMSQGQQVIPLAPEAAELFKYTSMPVGMMTGIPQIGYSLYEINTGKIKLPISLSYHASGIKVTQKATWVGLGWSLTPGGAISRTVRGGIDENDNYGWFNHNSSLDTFPLIQDYSTMQNWEQGRPDAEPDFFNYNIPGKSGKFIYSRESGSFITIPYQPLKISRIKDPSNTTVNNTYLVTDDDGTRYYFDWKTSVFKDDAGFQKYVQGWNLTRIISNDNSDTLFLKYEYPPNGNGDMTTETVRSFSKTYSIDDTQAYWSAGNIVSSSSDIHYDVSKLSEITFRQGKVSFYANTARTDYGGNMLDSIVVYSKDETGYQKVRKITFAYGYFYDGHVPASFYDYRLKLMSFTKEDINGGQPETYRFDYNSTPLPAIFSYAADYWGFYNGAINADLMPNLLPEQEHLKNFGYVGTADRNPSEDFMFAGILNKITYPTGGYTQLQYESNKYLTSYFETKDTVVGSIDLNGGGRNVTTTAQANFQTVSPIGASSFAANITINFSAFSANAVTIAQSVSFKDVTAGTTIMTWDSDAYTDNNVPHTINYTYDCNTSHVYQVYAAVNDYATTSIAVTVTSKKNDSTTLTKLGGGIRVQSILSYNSDNSLQKKDVYKYGAEENGIGYMRITGDQVIHNGYYIRPTKKAAPFGVTGCKVVGGTKVIYLGQQAYPVVSFQGAGVLYPWITKYEYGNGIPNGKTIYGYVLPSDYLAIPQLTALGGKEIIDNSCYDELLRAEYMYKYNTSDGSYSPLKLVNNYYSLYNFKTDKAVAVREVVEWLPSDAICIGPVVTDISYMNYSLKSGVYRMSNTKEQEYDDNGVILERVVDYTYNAYTYPSTITRTDSKNHTIADVINYPGEHTATDPNAAVLNKMVSSNMIRQPYWKGRYNDGTLLSYQRTMFGDQWSANSNLIAPQTDTIWRYGNNASLTAGTISYQSYDKYGNLRQVRGQDGITLAYTWNTRGTYPLSQTVGASVNEVLHDGFEDAGSWTGVTRDGTQKYSGTYAGMINNAGTYANSNWINVTLAAATKFKYSGWIYSSGPSATINLLMKKSGEAGAYSYIDNISSSQTGKWVYVEREYSVPADVTSITIRIDNNGSGKVWFDDIRLRPATADMSTYTYLPLVGMTSKNDEGNHTVYYEYDGLGRLKSVKDKDGKIIKLLDYQYQRPITQ